MKWCSLHIYENLLKFYLFKLNIHWKWQIKTFQNKIQHKYVMLTHTLKATIFRLASWQPEITWLNKNKSLLICFFFEISIMSCDVKYCNNTYLKDKKLHFYSIPVDEKIRHSWIEKGQIDTTKRKRTCKQIKLSLYKWKT